MRLVVSWLRDFVDIDASAEAIAEKIGLRGFEVAAVEPLGGGDAVIDFEITANRPDALSVLGLAREVATAFDRPLTRPSHAKDARVALRQLQTGSSDQVSITIEADDLCPRYTGAAAEVAIAPSPTWLADRLAAAGVRPISNLVDITNYVNIELGQPMHAFDLDRLEGREIVVRRATNGEKLRTLDGVERTLDSEMLVIADRAQGQGIAGVMGGAASEVSDATRRIAFESAYFKPATVRRAARRLGLKTEASSRFERGANIGGQLIALERAAALLEQLGAGRIIGHAIDRYPHPRSPITVRLRRARLAALLGVSVPDADVRRILTGLGFSVTNANDGWDVEVPLFRVDVLREADLIEEVGRHYGFDRLEATFPAAPTPALPPDPRIPRDRLLRRVLTGAGLTEAVTFGFCDERAARSFTPNESPTTIAIANPLSAKFDTMRPLVLAGLVDAVAHNRRHGRRDVRLFEIGARFTVAGETRAVAIAWTGTATPEHWSAPPREVDFFDVKGCAERICASLGVSVRAVAARQPFLVWGQSASVVVADGPAAGTVLGFIGQLQPSIADERGLPRQDRVMLLELDLDALERARSAVVESTTPLPRFPSVVRDLSIIVSDTLPAEIIRGTIQAAAADRALPAPLAAIGVFDRYQGKGVPDGSVSLSLRLTFQRDDRTLTDGEVQQSFDAILAALVREHGAIQR